MKPVIVVTGGAGYIGSHTIIELLSQNNNFTIISIDNFSNSNKSTFDRIHRITGQHIENINIDLCDYNLLQKQLKNYSNIIGIIHFAAYKSVPDSVADPLSYYHNNIQSLVNILKVCEEFKIPNFIFSSSCSVYGNTEHLPVLETTPLLPAESPYAHTKQLGEDIVKNFSLANPDFKAILLRYFNPVGAHMSGLNGELPINKPNSLVPIITQTAVGKIPQLTVFGGDYETRDGSCVRDYIHVSDIAIAHVNALNCLMEHKHKKQVSTYNLGTGNGVTVLEAITMFETVSAQKLNYIVGPRRQGDVIAIYANNTLAKDELNWIPKYSLKDMIESAWKWQLNLENEH